ncbi:MAG: hypothetical protein Gyms2KO_42680 [Gymnodinialimonas sp.]
MGEGGFVAAENLDIAHWVGALIRGVEGSLCSYEEGYDGASRRRLGENGALVWRGGFERGTARMGLVLQGL